MNAEGSLLHGPGNAQGGGAWIGRSVPRVDGGRHVAGAVRYSADLVPAGALFVTLVRSPHACARIVAIEAADARAMPGVAAVVDGAEAEALCAPTPQVLPFRQPDAAAASVRRAAGTGAFCPPASLQPFVPDMTARSPWCCPRRGP